MNCHATRAALNALVDREWTAGLEVLTGAARHLLTCRECRATWRSLLRQRRLSERLSSGSVPAHLREGVLGRLHTAGDPAWEAATRVTPPTVLPAAPQRQTWALKVAATTGVVILAGALGVTTIRPGRAENTPEALARVNTWHLSGWKIGPTGARTPWEVWGRRKPFLYREEIGDQVLLDDGQARLHLLPLGNRQLAVRTRSLQTMDDARWTRLTVGTDWKGAEPFKTETSQVIYQWTDSGMQGPGSVAHDYFFVDRSSWLPTRWEYREGRAGQVGKEKTVSSLEVEYDVPIPEGMDSARPPAGAQVVDALAAPSTSLPVNNVEQVGGLAAQVEPVKVDASGNVLIRTRAWLGTTTLGSGSLFYTASLPIWARTVDGQRHPWAICDNRGRPFVLMYPLRISPDQGIQTDGSRYHWLAPLEPLRPGDPLPETLTLNLTLTPYAMVEGRSRNLLHQDLRWVLTLPEAGGEVRWADLQASPLRRAPGFQEEEPVAARLAATRAQTYECQSDYPRAIRWMQLAVLACGPDSNMGQSYRLNLAALYRRNKNIAGARETLQEVIETQRRYPKTWSYYAQNARLTLRDLPRTEK